jgi:hypothetical protein
LLDDLLNLKIKNIKFNEIKNFNNISEYEFSLIKAKTETDKNDKLEMYFQIIEKHKIKESIFCYWSLIYDEEMKKHNIELENQAVITELETCEEKSSVLLQIEDNNTEILKYGTLVYFIDLVKYLKNNKNDDINKYKTIIKYLESNNKTTLLIGIKLNDNIKQGKKFY